MPVQKMKIHVLRMLIIGVMVVVPGWLSGHLVAATVATLVVLLGWSLLTNLRLIQLADNAVAPSGTKTEPGDSEGLQDGIRTGLFDRFRLQRAGSRIQQENDEARVVQMQNVVNALPDAILLLDEKDVITWFNAAAGPLLGFRDPDDLGQTVTNLIRVPDFINWLAVAADVSSPLELPGPLDSNQRLSVSVVSYPSGDRLLILRDTTRLFLADQVRRDFVANVSHELRSPLTVLLGYLESIEEDCPDDIRMAVERMKTQANSMQALLTDLLELSRVQDDSSHDDEAVVDVPRLLMKLRQQAREFNVNKVMLEFHAEPGLALRGTKSDLESAFRNLIDNAIHYTPDGGSVTIRWQREGDDASLTVSDTGIGIPKRDIPRLTERFYRVGSDRSRNTGGTGLGLAIVKHVLNAHQGRLEINSTLGIGSVFKAIFPADRCLNLPRSSRNSENT
jgi:two-component system phosphate regulon sensor histidine kinase PhoR